MKFESALLGLGVCLLAGGVIGCASPYHSDRGALFGGLTGAGLGAIVGEAAGGNPLAGAVIGGAVGTMTGAAVGDSLDQIEARNRAEIERRLGRPVRPGSVTVDDVIAMSRAGVETEVIVNHIRIHGTTRQLQTADVIHLQNQGVNSRVIQAMQEPPPERAVAVRETPPPVIIEEHYYGHPWYGPRYYHPRHRWYRARPGPRMSWGFSFSSRR